MMTLADVRKFAPHNANEIYSPEKSAASWELVNLDRNDRATRIERFIADQIERRSGYKATATQNDWPWDITVDLEHGPVKIEVKSALRKKGYESQYQLQNIKPNLFNYIFLVLITPDGIRMSWAESEKVRNMCRYKIEGISGYSIFININKWNRGEYDDWLFDIEDFPYGS
jgi:hypothetical protein